VSQSNFHSVLLSHSYSAISDRATPRGAPERTEEVNSLQNFSQKVYARFVTAFAADDGQTMAEYGIVLALITLAVVATIGLLGGAVNDKLAAVLKVITP
jgi:Flp pilus assembly pilin Flp